MGTTPPLLSHFNRRTFIQIVAVAGAAGALRFAPWDLADSKLHMVRKSQPMMGTVLNFIVCSKDRDQAEAAMAATTKRMLAIESKLTRFRENSEVGRLNRTGFLTEASDDLQAVINLAHLINQKSNGAFDITVLPLLALYQNENHSAKELQALLASKVNLVGHENLQLQGKQISLLKAGMEITLDGIGKGYIVDQGTETLGQYGFKQVYVEAGGDLFVKGGKTNGEPWRIGIQNPRPQMARKLEVIEAENMAVATSGDYYQPFSPDFRLNHILNPRTGISSPELASCTVTAPNTALADGLATACMVLGANDAIDLLAQFPGCEGYFIAKDLKVRKTLGFIG